MVVNAKNIIQHTLLLALFLVFFTQGMLHIRNASITFDEGPHLATGYATLRTGDFRLQPVHIHPPLANVLAAAPLLLQDDLPDPRAISSWEIASLSAVTDAVVWQYPHPARLALASRLPILWLAVLLGALICRWARDLGGTKAGLLALALYAFDPNMIAHGTLVTTDMAATFFMVATLYAANQRVGESANRRVNESANQRELVKWMGVGVLLGLALLTKVSALMLVPVLGLMVVICEWRNTHHVSHLIQYAIRITQYAVCIALPAALVLWAGYGFEVSQVAGLPFPIPAATHMRIYQSLQEHYHLGHPTFLMGRVSSHGWWWYFPVAFVLKTPLPVLVLALFAIIRTAYCALRKILTRRFHALRITHYVLLPFPTLYAVTSLFSTVNIGYRHLLPLLPFLYVGLGLFGSRKYGVRKYKSPNKHVTRSHLRALLPNPLLLTLFLWLILGTLAVSPNYLAYFNEFAGGPAGGYRYLVDSNLDWGQNLWQLRDWMAAHDEAHVYYAHYSPARPQVYGIEADFLPPDPRAVDFIPWHPAPGLYAIGATVLQGPYAPDINTYAWFRGREPTARLGHALFIYRVAETYQPPPGWAVVCNSGDPHGDAHQLRTGLATPNLRVVAADCTRSWLYRAEKIRGIYLLPSNMGSPPDAEPAFRIREANGSERPLFTVTAPPEIHSGDALTTTGPLTFLGGALASETSQTVAFLALWRVEALPDRPLSLFGHLLGPDGIVVAGDDGLGISSDQWQLGDLLVQQHRFALPPDAPPGRYTLVTGGYWLDDMARWQGADAPDGAFVIGEITVSTP